MKITKGNLIEMAINGDFDLIVHGCNCFGTMGAGVAKGIKAAFPQAFEADLATERGSKDKLGTCSFAEIPNEGAALIVVNAYTQFDWRGSGVKVDYEAVRSCMRWIKARYSGKRIGLPKIGAGLAGGDWKEIASIIEEELAGEDITLVEYVP